MTDRSNDDTLGDRATALLQQLIRLRTVNPPGDELIVQELLAGELQRAGFAVQLLEAVPGRPNLIAELWPEAGEGRDAEGPTLTLLSHADTVLADPSDWSRDPWGAELAEGMLWGRGAIDMKNQTAAEVAAVCTLAESGWRPARGLLRVIVCADEETGGGLGARWLCEEHPEKVRTDLLINEGGGAPLVVGDQTAWSIGVGEKGVCRFVVRTRGTAAHASTPGIARNALVAMTPVIERLASAELPVDLTDAPRALLVGLGLLAPDATDGASADAAVALLRERAPKLAPLIEPMLRVTAAPTMISASSKINVIPATCELRVDCRIPAGMTADEAKLRVAQLLAGLDDIEVEFTEAIIGNGSPTSGPVWDAIVAWLQEGIPGAVAVPTVLPGFTDSRWFRDAFPGCQAYGFFPHLHMPLEQTYPMMHAADERIDLRDLAFAARAYRDLTVALLG